MADPLHIRLAKAVIPALLKRPAFYLFTRAMYQLKRPYRFYRRSTVSLRLNPCRGRKWRSAIPSGLQFTLMRGQGYYTYKGVKTVKQPFEIALYMKLVWELKPQTIIEIGSRAGGTAIWLGDILHTFGNGGRVFSIDIEPPSPPPSLYHTQTVHFIRGNEADLAKVELPMGFTWKTLPHPWLVINDASHVPRLMAPGLDHFDQHCCPGDVLIVEDANLTEFGADRKYEGGPAQAIARFLNANPNWEIMTDYCDFFGYNVTCNPNGYLRRV